LRTQFLVEAILITVIGGTIGVVFGAIIVTLLGIGSNLLGYNFHMGISLDSILTGLGAAIIFGLLFGLYPARKASMLSPVEALRYE
nr:FtsX-like permease family protein [Candidatus Gracilibacteria bacterium]